MAARGPIFVVGTGRSGTHFLTRCLLRHEAITDLTGGTENSFVFETAVRLATGRSRLGDRLVLPAKYRVLMTRARGRVLLDQSHPNLWNIDLLSGAFPDATWLGIVRDPRAVVASMLNKPGVRRRTEHWEDYPFPNAFLGIDEQNRDRFVAASLAGRCAYRWASHSDRIAELAAGGRIHLVSYEALVLDTATTVDGVLHRIGLPAMPPVDYDADAASLDKWRSELTDDQVEEVMELARSAPGYRYLQQAIGTLPA